MIAQLFEGEERGNAMGTYQILLTLAPAVAPILGVEMNIDVAKNRDGICGIIKMMYDKTKQVFEEKKVY